MGKIRVKTLGQEEQEQKQRKRDEARRVLKKAKKSGVTVEEVKATETPDKKTEKPAPGKKETKQTETKDVKKTPSKKQKEDKTKKVSGPRKRSIRYVSLRKQIDRAKLYPSDEAFTLVLASATTKFTGSVEAHVNLKRKATFKSTDTIKVERKFPLVHAVLGKTTEDKTKLTQELDKLIKKVSLQNISKLTLSSSMGPGIKVAIS